MEFEFDKEIDAILRKTRMSEAAPADNLQSVIQIPQPAHLDADDISAFAENALPEKTKLLYIKHLADCPRCRTVLANVISLNSEADIETASSTVAANVEPVAAPLPWYRKFLLFPQLAYTMGGLVLIFSGLMVYLLTQNAERNSDSMISKVTDKTQSVPQADHAAEPTPGEVSSSNSNAAMLPNKIASSASANRLVSSNTTANAPASTQTAANSPNSQRREAAESGQNLPAKSAPPPPPPLTLSEPPAAGSGAPAASQNKTMPADDEKKVAEKPQTADKTDAQENDLAEGSVTRAAPAAPKMAARKAVQSETKSVGGRNFTRRDNVWYDVNYHGQATTNVSRGSDDYKKLDGGLRSLADSFSGTVVIVYKSKAYRIQ